MFLTPEQIKGRIKNIAKKSGADARILLRIFMMERFLERISNSKYSGNFIIKGGILVTSLIGVSMRSTMDIDTTIRNFNLSEDEARAIVEEIISVDIEDGVTFEISDISHIMDDMEYPGIRINLNASIGKIMTPIKLDISTGDAITPREVEYNYKLMLEDRSIMLWTYNLETILSEKTQTILARGVLNTRMRDFYDIHVLLAAYGNSINPDVLIEAFAATCRRRGTPELLDSYSETVDAISKDTELLSLWKSYRDKYFYADGIDFSDVIDSLKKVLNMLS